MEAAHALGVLWRHVGGRPEAIADATLTGADPALPSSFRVGTAAQVSIAAAALAAAEFWRIRGGSPQRVCVDMREAAAEFRSERYLRIADAPAPEMWDAIAGLYPCGDGGWVRLHTNFAHHRDGVLALLGCDNDRESVGRALMRQSSLAFEQAAADAGLVVAALRRFEQWDAHPQGRAVAALPTVSIERIADAPAAAPPPGARPLQGIRVLEMTRIIAGPVCGRTLAAHGADVLLVTGPHLPSIAPLVVDTGRGKRSAHVDLRTASGLATARELIAGADVFVQGYRPGALAARGLGPLEAASIRPGIVCVSLSAYGHEGPWARRRGFDSLVQTATGFNHAEGLAAGGDVPRALPAQALDHAAGHLMAFGAMTALARRATEGGSWHVRVSLAGVGHWLRGLGRIERGFDVADPGLRDVADLIEASESGFGPLRAVRHAGRLSLTPPAWSLPSVPLGTDPPRWQDDSPC
jgi:crotonobetainyl-CoA:carnitine CoA-transferase CaiB-like acyl-CoA transferase